MNTKADEFFLEAHRQQLLGNRDAAFELFNHSLELNPNSPPTLYELAFFYLRLGQDSTAIEMMKQALQYAPDNYWYHDALVNLYVQANRTDDAISVLEEMSRKYPGKIDILGLLESLYSNKQDWKNVITTLNKIEKLDGKNEQLSLEKFRVFLQMNDEKSAYKEMMALADEYPNDLKYRILIGDLLLKDGKNDEALEVYNQVAKEDPENINLMLSLAQYYSDTKQDSLYHLQLEKIITAPKIDIQRRLAIMNGLVVKNIQTQADTTKLMELFRKVLASPQYEAGMCELCLRYMVTRDAPHNAIKPVAQQLLSIDPENLDARSLLLQYAVDENNNNEVIKICTPAVEFAVDDPLYYYYLGIAYYQSDSVEQVIDVLSELVSRFKDTKILELLTNSYSILGDAYHKLGENAKAFAAYDTCLVYRPEEPLVLNNYAYYLSLLGKDLDRAEKMSALSLEKDTANYTYIDTYAWILFKQKKYRDAKKYIDNALLIMEKDTLKSENANIYEHAGDIYSKCGLIDNAITLWQKALTLSDENKAIIEKKIKRRKFIE